MSVQPFAACVFNSEGWEVEDLFAFIVMASMSLEVQTPMPFSKCANGITEAAQRVISKLDAKGIVSEERIQELTIKMVKDGIGGAQKAMQESGFDAAVEKIEEELKKQAKTAKQN